VANSKAGTRPTTQSQTTDLLPPPTLSPFLNKPVLHPRDGEEDTQSSGHEEEPENLDQPEVEQAQEETNGDQEEPDGGGSDDGDDDPPDPPAPNPPPTPARGRGSRTLRGLRLSGPVGGRALADRAAAGEGRWTQNSTRIRNRDATGLRAGVKEPEPGPAPATPEVKGEPGSWRQALKRPDRERWIKAAQEEIAGLEQNETWNLVPRSEVQGKPILRCMMTFKEKRNERGEVVRPQQGETRRAR
jgi:hypothetical protein